MSDDLDDGARPSERTTARAKEIIEVAVNNPHGRLSAWEQTFITDFHHKASTFPSLRISDKQWAVLERIAEKIGC